MEPGRRRRARPWRTASSPRPSRRLLCWCLRASGGLRPGPDFFPGRRRAGGRDAMLGAWTTFRPGARCGSRCSPPSARARSGATGPRACGCPCRPSRRKRGGRWRRGRGEFFWEGADPTRSGVRVLDVAHDPNDPACRRLRPALEALERATPDLGPRWRDWPTGGGLLGGGGDVASDGAGEPFGGHRSLASGGRPGRDGDGVSPARRPALLARGDLLTTATASVAAGVAWAEGLGLRAPPSVLEGGRLLGMGALPVEQWRERLGLDG